MTESKTVIRLYFAKMKPAFSDLSAEEKMAFMKQDRENLDELGMKAVAMIDCGWSSDEWDYVGIEEWPSLAAIERRERFENEVLQVFKYVDSKTLLGTPQSFADYGKK